MTTSKGAMTIAEGNPRYKTDVSIIFNNERDPKEYVLRTTFDQLSVWRSKHNIGSAAFGVDLGGVVKDAARVDGEVWVFGIDATNAQDISAAVRIAMDEFKVRPEVLLSDVYVKNLNANVADESLMDALVEANKSLYEKTCSAIKGAAQLLGCHNTLNFWVFSHKNNYKIGKDDLHSSLKNGGASSVEMDPFKKHQFKVGNNSGKRTERFFTNLHLSKLNP